MIGELFPISATNFSHAVLREAAIPADSAAGVRPAPLSGSGDEQADILVEREGFPQVPPISEKRVRACMEADRLEETQEYTDELADQI